MLIPVLEIVIVLAGAIAVIGTAHSLMRTWTERTALRMVGQNGIKRSLLTAHLTRHTCRMTAALAIFVGGIHLIQLPNGTLHAGVIAKAVLALCAVAMVGTIITDIYCHRVAARLVNRLDS